jgi:hypothetical protein
LRNDTIAGQLPNYHGKWKQMKLLEARIILARAIVAKVPASGQGKAKVLAEKPWYQELQAFLDKN